MGIKETLTLNMPRDMLYEYGQLLPKCLEIAAEKTGIQLSQSDLPQCHIDFEQKYPPQGLLATSIIETREDSRVLFINPDTLAACAQDIMGSLNIRINTPEEQAKLEEYCLFQAMVFFELQASLQSLSIEEIEKIQTQYTKIYF